MKISPSTKISLLVLGGFTISAQIYFLREFLATFNGNELVIGTTLSLWLLLTGAGVWLARTFPVKTGIRNFATFLMMLLSVLPLITIFGLQQWKSSGLLYGAAPDLWDIFYRCLVALLPCCLLNGYLFILLTGLLRESDETNAPGKAYAWESLGGLLGGALVNFILLWFVDTLSGLRIFFALFVFSICLTTSFPKLSIRLSVYLSSVILIFFIFCFPFRQLSLYSQYREQTILLDKDTPYGHVTITQSGEQLNYYGDGTLLFSSGNTMWNEESVHYAMLQRDSAANVLMVGGGISGAIPEVLKYRPQRLDYVEINPVIAELAMKYVGNARPGNVFVHRADVRSFLAKEKSKYDFCLVNVPEPSTLQLNRYFTFEFISLLKNYMTPAGVVCLSLPATSDYVSPEAGLMNGSFYNTLKSVFHNVVIVPGNRNWFLASDGPLSPQIARLADTRMQGYKDTGMEGYKDDGMTGSNEFVNSYYIDDNLLAGRSDFILKNLPKDAPVNHDFHPVMYRQQLTVWLSQFGFGWEVVLAVVAFVAALILLLLNRTAAGMFAAGFTGVSLEVIIMLVLQVTLGYIFSVAGIVIMLFMAGLAAGPWVSGKLFPIPARRHFIKLMCLMTLTPLLALLLIAHCSLLVACLLVLITSMVLGMLYPVSVSVSPGDPIRSASRNYAADLFGSAIGAILVPLVFLPVMGLGTTLFVLAGLNLVATLLFLTTKDTKGITKAH